MAAIHLTTQKIGSNEIAVLTFDLPGEKVNKLSSSVMKEFQAHLNGCDQISETAHIYCGCRY
jgi:enoyl-CoA hydratase/carnithine racemase